MSNMNVMIVIFLTTTHTKLTKSDDWVLAKQDIVHPSSGLILKYKSDYRPANKIVTLSTVIPMVADMCYLLPISALKRVARCNLTNHVINFANRGVSTAKQPEVMTRKKRFLAEVFSLGMSGAALTMGVANMVQTSNLKQEVKALAETVTTLQKYSYTQDAKILHLEGGQFKIAVELNYTQQAINRTMDLVNQHTDTLRGHDEAIRKVGEFSTFINNKPNVFMHKVEGHFLRTSIESIQRGDLNLHFIHHDDMPKVVEYVVKATNISFEDNNSSISMLDLITRLLVRQEISFVPTIQLRTTVNGAVIGELVFTSYFAASNYDEKPFLIYEPIPIPFNLAHKRVRLAQMPAYIAIRPDTREFIRWSQEEAEPCSFDVMTSCRTTSAIRKDLEDMCIYQVITNLPLKSCRVEPYADFVFVRQIGRYWAISTNSTSQCHTVSHHDPEQHKLIENRAITLPETAIVPATNSTALSCDFFYLPAIPTESSSKLVVYQNSTMSPLDEEVLDLRSFLQNQTHWQKLPYIPFHIQTIIEYMTNTTHPPEILFWGQFKTHETLTFNMVVIGILALVVIFLVVYIRFKHPKKSKVTITIPSWKTIEQQELAPLK